MGTTNSKEHEAVKSESHRLANEAANKLGRAIGSKAAEWHVGGVRVAAKPGSKCITNKDCMSNVCIGDKRGGKCA